MTWADGVAALDLGFELGADLYPLVRLRLADEIHRRAYHDVGVEVSPGAWPAESFVLSTPHCGQGDTVLGELLWSVDRSRLAAGRFESWRQFRAHAFDVLGLERWRTRRHLGCFHRRGKARYDLTFAVMCRLVTERGVDRAAWALGADTPHPEDAAFDAMIAANGGTPPPGRPPRFLAVSCCGTPLTALRGDGWAVTPGGVLALDELWWRGLDVDQLAGELRRLAGHEHSAASRHTL